MAVIIHTFRNIQNDCSHVLNLKSLRTSANNLSNQSRCLALLTSFGFDSRDCIPDFWTLPQLRCLFLLCYHLQMLHFPFLPFQFDLNLWIISCQLKFFMLFNFLIPCIKSSIISPSQLVQSEDWHYWHQLGTYY